MKAEGSAGLEHISWRNWRIRRERRLGWRSGSAGSVKHRTGNNEVGEDHGYWRSRETRRAGREGRGCAPIPRSEDKGPVDRQLTLFSLDRCQRHQRRQDLREDRLGCSNPRLDREPRRCLCHLCSTLRSPSGLEVRWLHRCQRHCWSIVRGMEIWERSSGDGLLRLAILDLTVPPVTSPTTSPDRSRNPESSSSPTPELTTRPSERPHTLTSRE